MTVIRDEQLQLSQGVLHYLEAGPEDGPVVLLLHGMKFKAETWKELGTLEHLAQQGVRAIGVDMPGFGQSPASDQNPVAVLEECITTLGLAPVTLVGPSMGGRIALEFTLEQGKLVDKLVLVGAVGVEENKEKLAQISQPTLIVWGEQDQVSPPAMSDILLDTIAGSKRVFFINAPHPCYLDQPEKWHAELSAFVCRES